MTINALADELVMDRTTLGRNVLPLEREGLIAIAPGQRDRRSKELRLAAEGAQRLRSAFKGWTKAHARFKAIFGRTRTEDLRALPHAVSSTELEFVGGEGHA